MGLSLDGVNPFSMQRSNHSTWPVMVLFYNLPLWLVTKKFSTFLCLIIYGKESPTSKNIDIFLFPLIEEFQQLWEGVDVLDASADIRIESRCFKLRGILMWTISDFPAYGLISRLCTKGYLVCPICGPNTISRCARGPKKLKQVYLGARHWTAQSHPYRSNRRFNGQEEQGTTPVRQSANDILRGAAAWEDYLQGARTGRPGRMDGPQGSYRCHGVRRKSLFFSLPYWQVEPLPLKNT
jgi:hypothetical protein